jgi:hypothetical protein
MIVECHAALGELAVVKLALGELALGGPAIGRLALRIPIRALSLASIPTDTDTHSAAAVI